MLRSAFFKSRGIGLMTLGITYNHEIMQFTRHAHSHCSKPAFQLITSGITIPEASKKNGGEDASFILPGDVGVFDGVGGWSKSGIDAGLYSRHLAAAARTEVEKQRAGTAHSVNLSEVLDVAAASAKINKLTGSTTVCMASLDEAAGVMNVLNLGDSGLMIFRKVGKSMQVVGYTRPTLHGFNFPAQIGNIADPKLGRMDSDTSEDATAEVFQVQDGDVAVLGSDGLWDNVFETDIMKILEKSELYNRDGESRGVVEGDIERVTQVIAQFALAQSKNKKAVTPWLVELKKEYLRCGAPFDQSEPGGKPDDITVVVAYCQSCRAKK